MRSEEPGVKVNTLKVVSLNDLCLTSRPNVSFLTRKQDKNDSFGRVRADPKVEVHKYHNTLHSNGDCVIVCGIFCSAENNVASS